MNIRYPIYEGVYRILTTKGKETSNNRNRKNSNKGRKGKRDKSKTGKKAQRKGSKKRQDSRQHSACTEK